MSISKRLIIIISALILLISLALGIVASLTARNIIYTNTNEWMLYQTRLGAQYVASELNTRLQIYEQVARIRRITNGDLESQLTALAPYPKILGIERIIIASLDGNAVSVPDGRTLPNISTELSFQSAANGTSAISDIITDTSSNTSSITWAVPFRNEGDDAEPIVGVLLFVIGMDFLEDIVNNIHSKGDSASIIYDGDGNIAAMSKETETLLNRSAGLTSSADDAVRKIVAEESGVTQFTQNKRQWLCGWSSTEGFDMTLSVVTAEDSLQEGVEHLTILIIIIMAIAIAVGIASAFIISRWITNKLKLVQVSLTEFGNGDLTQIINIHEKDEVGDMSNSLNKSMTQVKDMVTIIKQKNNSLFAIGNDLSSQISEANIKVKTITNAIQNVRNRVIKQNGSVSETSAAMDQVINTLQNLNSVAEDQAAEVSQSSAAIEEMLANIQSVTTSIEKNSQSVKDLSSASVVGREGLNHIVTDIQEIAQESQGLLKINSVIAQIAGQTNLLSMNASIEAAHAGDSGKGFAVVADEIRSLAENSSKQSKTINTLLKNITGAIDKVSAEASEVLKRFDMIEKNIRSVSEQTSGIKQAMDEQTAGSHQILETVVSLKERADEVKSSADEMLSESLHVVDEGRSLAVETEEIANCMEDMADSTGQINDSVTQVMLMSNQNRQHINTVEQELSRFKVEKLAFNYDMIIAKHRVWITNLCDYLNGSDVKFKIDPEDYKHCDLGKWIYGEDNGQKFKMLEELNALEDIHHTFHNQARLIIKLKDEGDLMGADKEYEKLMGMYEHISSLLIALKDKTKPV